MSIVQDQKYICKQNANRAFFNVKKQGSPLLSFSKTTASHISTSFHYHKIRLFINVPETLTIIRLKGKSQNRCFKRTKVCQIFQKNEHFLPPDTHIYVLLKIHRSFKTTTFPVTEVQPSELMKNLVKKYDSNSCYSRSWYIVTLTLFPVSSWNILLRVMLLQVFQDANLFP